MLNSSHFNIYFSCHVVNLMLGLMLYLLLETAGPRQSTHTLRALAGGFQQDDEDSTDPEDSEVADSMTGGWLVG